MLKFGQIPMAGLYFAALISGVHAKAQEFPIGPGPSFGPWGISTSPFDPSLNGAGPYGNGPGTFDPEYNPYSPDYIPDPCQQTATSFPGTPDPEYFPGQPIPDFTTPCMDSGPGPGASAWRPSTTPQSPGVNLSPNMQSSGDAALQVIVEHYSSISVSGCLAEEGYFGVVSNELRANSTQMLGAYLKEVSQIYSHRLDQCSCARGDSNCAVASLGARLDLIQATYLGSALHDCPNEHQLRAVIAARIKQATQAHSVEPASPASVAGLVSRHNLAVDAEHERRWKEWSCPSEALFGPN